MVKDAQIIRREQQHLKKRMELLHDIPQIYISDFDSRNLVDILWKSYEDLKTQLGNRNDHFV